MSFFDKKQFQQKLLLRTERKEISVLVIETQRFSRQMLEKFLQKNFVVYSADNTKDGVNLYMEHAPNIVFLDLELPDASGLEICELLCKLDKECFIFALGSPGGGSDNVYIAMEKGAKSFLLKPYTQGKIMDAVGLFLKEKKIA